MIFQYIKDELDRKGMSLVELAEASSVNYSTCSNYLRGKRGGKRKFENVLAIVRTVFPETEYDVMDQYLRDHSDKLSHRYGMEYAAINRQFKTLEWLVNKNIDKNNPNREWAEFYLALLNRAKGKLNPGQLFKSIMSIGAKTPESRALLNILSAYSLYDSNQFEHMFDSIKTLEEELKDITSDFLRERFTIRYKQILANSYLRFFNDPVRSRETAEEILELTQSKFVIASVYSTISLTYMFSDYERSRFYLELSKTTFEDAGISADYLYNNNLAFLKNVHNLDVDEINDIDREEFAHHLINRGCKEQALHVLLEKEKRNNLSLLGQLYKSLAEVNRYGVWSVLSKYTSLGDLFFATFVKSVLENLGEDPHLINAVMLVKEIQEVPSA